MIILDPKDTTGKTGVVPGVSTPLGDTQTPAAPTTPTSNVGSGVFSGSKGMGETSTPGMGSMTEPPVSTPIPQEDAVGPKVPSPMSSVPDPMSGPASGMGTTSTSPLGSVPEPADTTSEGAAADTPTEEEEGGSTGGTGGGTGNLGA
ncbi:hypothetical protein A2962_04245 [Candidatus Woesebacteria bacterium RIFCSPLOWO2_01_FULL_39_61]|uniref:Uncharacterized protein n=1 Tax=Candidatus Woesebacteria bacterium RIFCSPHIGHO2_02_FULL_39_13 TaxID=1802505 RepID=A0A1F7YXW7_9BACT|nr:MAG: hypothetical protein A2692_05190 [Candidatus Woesebacteria bacterium RIFCSPHIGHO2_01_FULL_39_95]OGM32173.1 MAG: hypothetical protein A3D01_02185 [Candidatus Woesebacteria bacterium RIFCSPHIGHO2_02_FULL_39_13]OGM36532.1 MAG: hypothetical protein A3E13_04250 [Candidatus Woesebacteria bacterium RIFCSPHIGHO2_12_FULL_40_20]OGM65963.1 MAG: hypothetical protein A2962_04245 [Candidatus Woesebacteria bacterium RIFCSPLOWO2_01_FULL_39_61]OGM71395.1 MAG: hypothetical protein A3H19_04485 [Candidatus